MTDLLWKVNRLRAMGGREIAHRAGRWVAQYMEARRVAAGKVPLPVGRVGPALALFPSADELAPDWVTRFRLDEAGLRDLMAGRIGFFGHEPLAVGTPVQWSRCPLTGVVAPRTFGKHLDYRNDRVVGNVKFLWELGRHQHLVPLAAAYAVSGRRDYADAALAQIEEWIADNPYGVGIHWCSALEVALRLISWALVHGLIATREHGAGIFSLANDPDRLGRSIYQHAAFVRGFLSRHSSANNHLIGELTGLLAACRVFDLGARGDRWAAFAHRELEREAARQVYADGVDREQALYYHLWVLEYLLFAWILELRVGQPFGEDYGRRLQRMAEFLEDIRAPGGSPPQIGDADDGAVARFEPGWPNAPYNEVLAAVAAVSRGQMDQGAPQKAFWYRAIARDQSSPLRVLTPAGPRPYPRLYRDGGYAMLGGGSMHVVFDAGPLGYPSIAAHGHADALSICLAVEGRWWLVDPGTYAYHSDPRWRSYFRGTAAHNTLQVDGLDQSDIGGPFLWTRHARAHMSRCETSADGRQLAEGCHDGYRKLGVVHRRRVTCDAEHGAVEIRDSLVSCSVHRCELHFHFAPDLHVVLAEDDKSARISATDSRCTLALELPADWTWRVVCGQTDPPLGWYSPALGCKVPAPVLVGRSPAVPAGSFITRIRLHRSLE